MFPKKHFGQNFLTSIPARIAIAEAGELHPEDIVLEIGPGKGFLTKGLLEKGAHILALEKDRELIPLLSETFKEEIKNKQLTLLEGDVLHFDPPLHNLKVGEYKIIANIPYYITGAILSHFLSHAYHPSCIVVLIQKEVAERIVTKDNKESLLSLSVKVYGDPKIVYRVVKGSFNPIPKVDSAVLQIKNISKKNFKNQYHEELFFKLIHAGFAHKRKYARSNIIGEFKHISLDILFEKCEIDTKARAEDISLTKWLLLSQYICENHS